MSRLTRRQFLGSAAGVTVTSAFPHVWIRPAWAQAKEVRVLAWTHFVPAYDKWFDAFAEQWGAKNGVRVTIDHIPHLQIPAKIAGSGLVLLSDGQIQPLSSVHPVNVIAGYAGQEPWLIRGDPISFQGSRTGGNRAPARRRRRRDVPTRTQRRLAEICRAAPSRPFTKREPMPYDPVRTPLISTS